MSSLNNLSNVLYFPASIFKLNAVFPLKEDNRVSILQLMAAKVFPFPEIISHYQE